MKIGYTVELADPAKPGTVWIGQDGKRIQVASVFFTERFNGRGFEAYVYVLFTADLPDKLRREILDMVRDAYRGSGRFSAVHVTDDADRWDGWTGFPVK